VHEDRARFARRTVNDADRAAFNDLKLKIRLAGAKQNVAVTVSFAGCEFGDFPDLLTAQNRKSRGKLFFEIEIGHNL
jgi:hypothetical protein